MAQSDQVVQNATFPSVRADINDNLAALYSQSSGNSAPTVTVAHQPWVDTSSSPAIWKVRNGSNTAWITIGTLDPAGFITSTSLTALLPSQSGNAGKSLISNGTTAAWNPTINSGTAVATTSGTSVDFTSIPSWAKRITAMFDGVSTNGASPVQIQLGYSGGVETTGYFCDALAATVSSINYAPYSSGFVLAGSTAAVSRFGMLTIVNVNSNAWVASGTNGDNATFSGSFQGSKTLSGTLDRIRLTTINGTDTFDAGTLNITYE
jgi:hypothetical protein